ncbi:hypothetical protein BH09BAC2_BH09BAC2_22530 [soil metagenome]
MKPNIYSSILKTAVLIIMLGAGSTNIFAQVGIGTPTPDASAMLDVTSTSKGVLTPRMTTANRDLITLPATSLLIFNTDNNRYEYNSGTSALPVWTPLAAGGTTGTAWNLTGNAGTNPAVNFLGTTDNQKLIFRQNNIQAGILSGVSVGWGVNTLVQEGTGGNNVGIGNNVLASSLTTGYSNVAIGTNALTVNSSGQNNTALGTNTLLSNTSGQNNNAIAYGALRNNTSGINNTAIGYNALTSNIIGNNNTALGTESAANTTGNLNVSLGYRTQFNTTTGNTNISIGDRALLFNISGSNNIAIGSLAGTGALTNLDNTVAIGNSATVSQSNSMVIGGPGANALNVGIGTSLPAAKLHVVKAAADLTPAIIVGCPIFANNAAAIAGGLTTPGMLYRSSTGLLSVVY